MKATTGGQIAAVANARAEWGYKIDIDGREDQKNANRTLLIMQDVGNHNVLLVEKVLKLIHKENTTQGGILEMKKIIVFLLTAVLCLATLSVGMAAGDYVREGLHGELYPIEKFTPVVDGELDAEYLYSRVVNLRDNGSDFATGEIYYLWDDNALYFYVDIHDVTPTDGENGIDHESDCIEMLFSLFQYDTTVDNIKAKQATDPGDAQFRVFRTKDLSECTTIVDNGIKYQDGSHGGFGKWVYDNTDWDNPINGSNYIIHSNDAEGYSFEGFVKWSPELKEGFTVGEGDAAVTYEATIKAGAIVGLGIQVNDDINNDSKRDLKCYAENSAPNEWSMSGNRATCGMFQLVDNGVAPGTADVSVIFALLTVVSAGGFTVFATKKSKND